MPWSIDQQRTGIKMWVYEQSTPASTWTINHGMNARVSVEIAAYDDNNDLKKILPSDVVQVDENNTTIYWSTARKGFVTFVSLRETNS